MTSAAAVETVRPVVANEELKDNPKVAAANNKALKKAGERLAKTHKKSVVVKAAKPKKPTATVRA